MNMSLRLVNYITRYAPSRNKILGYLNKKNCQDPDTILIQSGYSESLMCDIWMRSFIALGKGKSEISRKLMQKGFPKDMILSKIEDSIIEINDWEGNKTQIIHKIHTLEQRGKSRRIISSQLISQYSYFRDEITDLLAGSDDATNLQKEVQKYKNRYNVEDKKNREKMIASLLRKGFSYSDIKIAISNP